MFASERVPAALQALGLVLGAVVLVETGLVLSDGALETSFLVGAGTAVPFVVGLVYGGHYLRRSSLSADRYPRVLGWCLSGLAGFVLVNVAIMDAIPPESTLVLVGWLRWAAALGGGIGLLVGVFEARGIERAARAEREAVRAEAERARRELLDDLTYVLRHEVLNASQVIDGYTHRLRNEYDLDESAREDLGVIQQRVTDLTTTIEEIRTLVDRSRTGPTGGTGDLATLLDEGVVAARDRVDAVTVETDVDPVAVRGAAVLPYVFADLLALVADRNGEGTSRVTVTARTADTTVEVVIDDDGTATALSADEPVGLAANGAFESETREPLVETLAEQYGVVVERPAEGENAEVVVEIPRDTGEGDEDGAV